MPTNLIFQISPHDERLCLRSKRAMLHWRLEGFAFAAGLTPFMVGCACCHVCSHFLQPPGCQVTNQEAAVALTLPAISGI